MTNGMGRISCGSSDLRLWLRSGTLDRSSKGEGKAFFLYMIRRTRPVELGVRLVPTQLVRQACGSLPKNRNILQT